MTAEHKKTLCHDAACFKYETDDCGDYFGKETGLVWFRAQILGPCGGVSQPVLSPSSHILRVSHGESKQHISLFSPNKHHLEPKTHEDKLSHDFVSTRPGSSGNCAKQKIKTLLISRTDAAQQVYTKT